MLIPIREFLQSRGGTIAVSVAFVIVMAIVGNALLNSFGTSRAGALSRDRLFICAETGESFRHELEAGEPIPVASPHSGENTGYPAELCYWTADGEIRQEPTAVLLNASIDKSGPTFCPDCDRLVVHWNPRPIPGAPPPTRDQLSKKVPQATLASGDE